MHPGHRYADGLIGFPLHLPGLRLLRRHSNRNLAPVGAADRDLHHFLIVERRDLQPVHVRLRHFLHPHSLPDPALSCVEHASPLQLLFSSAVVGLIRKIPHAHDELIFSLPQEICHIHGKRQITSQMLFRQSLVDVDSGELIHCAKVEEPAPARSSLHLSRQHPSVPEHLARMKAPLRPR